MAFCFHCGNQVADGMQNCPYCGASMMQQPQQQPVQQPMQQQPMQQPMQGATGPMVQPGLQPMQQLYPQQGGSGQLYQQPQPGYTGQMPQQQPGMQYPPQNGPVYQQAPGMGGRGPQPPQKKSHTGLIIGIISGVIAIAAVVIILFVWPGVLKSKDEEGSKTSASGGTEQSTSGSLVTEVGPGGSTEIATQDTESVTAASTEDPYQATEEIEATTSESTETKTEKKTEKTTEKKTEKKTEKTTEKKTEKKTEAKEEKKSFQDYGIKMTLEQGKTKTIPTCTWDDRSQKIKATVKFDKYTSEAASQEIINFGKDNNMDLTGYERKQVVLEIDFEKSEAFEKNGAALLPWICDWYNIDLYNSTEEKLTDSYDTEYYRAQVKVNGKKKYVYIWHSFDFQHKNYHMQETFTALVPAGYDGIVVGVADSRIDVEGKHIYDVFEKDKFAICYMK